MAVWNSITWEAWWWMTLFMLLFWPVTSIYISCGLFKHKPHCWDSWSGLVLHLMIAGLVMPHFTANFLPDIPRIHLFSIFTATNLVQSFIIFHWFYYTILLNIFLFSTDIKSITFILNQRIFLKHSSNDVML